MRTPSLPKGAIHWIAVMPKPRKKGKYLCGKKITRFNFTKLPDNITCKPCNAKFAKQQGY